MMNIAPPPYFPYGLLAPSSSAVVVNLTHDALVALDSFNGNIFSTHPFTDSSFTLIFNLNYAEDPSVGTNSKDNINDISNQYDMALTSPNNLYMQIVSGISAEPGMVLPLDPGKYLFNPYVWNSSMDDPTDPPNTKFRISQLKNNVTLTHPNLAYALGYTSPTNTYLILQGDDLAHTGIIGISAERQGNAYQRIEFFLSN